LISPATHDTIRRARFDLGYARDRLGLPQISQVVLEDIALRLHLVSRVP